MRFARRSHQSGHAATRPLIALLLALVLGYLASPYISFWRFTRAVQTNDRVALERYIDFPALRASLKAELHGQLAKPKERKKNALSGFIERVAPDLIDQLVDAFVTPDGIVALLTDPNVARGMKAKDPSVAKTAGENRHEFDFSRAHRAFFTGLRTFAVDLKGRKLHFRFAGWRWRLNRIELSPNE
ncbi:MAG: DUF2939 domain-containing protein [Chthoniobacterales bacterium]